MKVAQLQAYGPPQTSIACIEVDDAAAPGPEEVRFDVLSFPINPADVLLTEGNYATKPDLPALVGAECVGRVRDVGPNVDHFKPGDLLIHLGRENWVQQKTVHHSAVVKIGIDADPLQLSMLKVNPATAKLMLSEYTDLKPGDWVIQNAANSAVGGYLIALAKDMGLQTINVVRRPELIDPLKSQGADLVVVDGPSLAETVRGEIGSEAAVPLAIDAIAGDICERMAGVLSDGGVLVNYGMLSNKNCEVSPYTVVFRDISLRGFWLVQHLGRMAPDQVSTLYNDLADRVANGVLSAEIEATYSIDDIVQAVQHAGQSGRRGKILVLPNGPIN